MGHTVPPAPSDRWVFDHLGMVVPSLEKGRALNGSALGIAEWSTEWDDAVNGVRVQFGRDRAGIVWELLEPFGERSPVANALRTKVNLLNHVAYRVSDLAGEETRLRDSKAMPLGPARPAIAYDNANIQFFMLASGVLVELIEAPAHRHVFGESA